MKLTVSNLGPIKKATVELGGATDGLTVFVGPNGTGKSYLAKLIYGLQLFETLAASYFSHSGQVYQLLFGKEMGSLEAVLADLQQLRPVALQQALSALANLHAELFKDRLADFFNADSGAFNDTRIVYSELIALPEERLQAVIDATIEVAKLSLNPKPETSINNQQSPVTALDLVWAFCWQIFMVTGGGFADYFPAARSNFMLTYKEIYRARAEEHVGLESIADKLLLASKGHQTRKTGKLIRFDKPTEDFISRLYNLDNPNIGTLSTFANKLERSLYAEDRIVVDQSEGQLADFRYQIKQSENRIRLHLASSMVTETSPLLIGLRHWVQPNNLVIIDEPESHLHPEAQRALVNGLAEAVNMGVKIILITHSPYILSCVNNLLKFGNLQKKFPDNADVLKLKQDQPDMVALEKAVHAYHFGKDGIVKDIVKKSGLIDEAEFSEPFDKINEIYETMRDIEWEQRA